MDMTASVFTERTRLSTMRNGSRIVMHMTGVSVTVFDENSCTICNHVAVESALTSDNCVTMNTNITQQMPNSNMQMMKFDAYSAHLL